MKTKKIIRIISFVLFLLLLLLMEARIFIVYDINTKMGTTSEQFISKKEYDYVTSIKDGHPDFEELSQYFERSIGLVNLSSPNIISEFSSPVTISYYDAIDGNVVRTIRKGETIHFDTTLEYEGITRNTLGKSYFSLPTANKSWRLAFPFDDPDGELRYVRFSDYRKVVDTFFKLNPSLLDEKGEGIAKFLTKADYSYLFSSTVDVNMCLNGIYNSPHARLPLFTGALILLPIACIIFFCIWVVLSIRMKTKKIIRLTAFVLFLLLLLPIGARIIFVRDFNINTNPKAFADASKKLTQYDYADAVKDGNPDLDVLSGYFIKGVAAMAYPEPDYEIQWEIAVPKDIAYYDSIGGKVVHTISKGTVVNLQYDGEIWDNLGKSTLTLPTTDKSWHLAFPLDDPDGELLYVRVSDYRKLTDAFVKQNPEHFAAQKRTSTLTFSQMMTKADYSYLTATVLDRQMYWAGIYDSPLAALPYFTGALILLPIADVLCLGVWLVLFIRRKRA